METPPIGLIPRWIRDEQRLAEIDAAIRRYLDSNYPVPVFWIEERNDIIRVMRAGVNKEPVL